MSVHEAPEYARRETEPEALRLLSVNDVAGLLAISRDSVYRLVRTGSLPTVRVGHRLRFRVVEIDAYLKREPAA